MLTKGIVEKLIDSYKIKVRIPVYNKPNYVNGATSTDNLYEACICTLPNCSINVQVGDIVILGFEDDDTSQPIILGCLYAKDITDSKIDLISNSLQALNSATLPQNTSIGKVTARDLGYLTGLKSNVQGQIDTISSYLTNQAMKWQSYINHDVTEDLDTNEIIIPIVGFEKISQYRIFTDIYSSKTNNEEITASFIDSKGNERNLFSFSSVSPIDNGETILDKVTYNNSLSVDTTLPPNGVSSVTFFVNNGKRLNIPYGDGYTGWTWVKKNINTLHELISNTEYTFSPADSMVQALDNNRNLYTMIYKKPDGGTQEIRAYDTDLPQDTESFIGVYSKDIYNPGHLEFRDVEAKVPILYYRIYSEGFCINSNYIQTVCGSFSTSSSGGYILEDGIKLSNSLIDIKSLKIKLSSGSLIKKGTKISMEVLYK